MSQCRYCGKRVWFSQFHSKCRLTADNATNQILLLIVSALEAERDYASISTEVNSLAMGAKLIHDETTAQIAMAWKSFVNSQSMRPLTVEKFAYWRKFGTDCGVPQSALDDRDLINRAAMSTTLYRLYAGQESGWPEDLNTGFNLLKDERAIWGFGVTIRPYSDGFVICRDAASAKAEAFVTGEGWFSFNLVNLIAHKDTSPEKPKTLRS